MRSGLPLPLTSIGAVILLLGLVVGMALGTSPGPQPVEDIREPAAEPGITNIGGDEPPMEFTPSASTSQKPRPVPITTTPPAQSRPVVTPQEAEPEMSVARTTAVPTLPELPTLTSAPAESENPRNDIGA